MGPHLDESATSSFRLHDPDHKQGKKKKKTKPKDSGSYCQRLVRDLDRAEIPRQKHRPGSRDRERRRTSRLLALPPEIRQQILYLTLDDEELIRAPPAQTALKLSVVCYIFKSDMDWVLQQWTQRSAELAKEHAVQKGAFDSYIADLMRPLKHASKQLTRQKRIRDKSRKQRLFTTNWNAHLQERKLNRFDHGRENRWCEPASEYWINKRGVGPSQAEMDAVDKWRRHDAFA